MSTLNIRLPDSLHQQLRRLAKSEGTSINQFVSSAVAEKLAALRTVDYLEERARRGTRKKFDAALRTVPSDPPTEFDKLAPAPSGARGKRKRPGQSQ